MTLIVIASGGADSVVMFVASTGASTATTFGFGLNTAPPDLAVGVDDSVYVTHEDGVVSDQATFISRVAPSGAVRWISIDLGTLGPQPVEAMVDPSTLALGQDDFVVTIAVVVAASGEASAAKTAAAIPIRCRS
jgi:hypothetical protein